MVLIPIAEIMDHEEICLQAIYELSKTEDYRKANVTHDALYVGFPFLVYSNDC
jgi:hypothetical protein